SDPLDHWTCNASGGIGSCSNTTWTLPRLGIVFNQWVDFLVHYRFHSTKAAGPITQLFYRVGGRPWVTAVDNNTQPNTVADPTYGSTFRWEGGLYKDEGYTPYTTLYFGGMVISSTRADAEAAMFR